MENLCPQLHGKNYTFHKNRSRIQLLNQRESAANIHQTWTTDKHVQHLDSCNFTVDSNIYLKNGSHRRGIFASVRKLNFRQDEYGRCIDYVRFALNGGEIKDFCGSFELNSEMGSKAFFNEPDGIINIFISIDKTVSLKPNQHLKIDLVFTAYESMLFVFIEK